jgi:hypothetical protein
MVTVSIEMAAACIYCAGFAATLVQWTLGSGNRAANVVAVWISAASLAAPFFIDIGSPGPRGVLGIASLFYFSRVWQLVSQRSRFVKESLVMRFCHVGLSFHDIQLRRPVRTGETRGPAGRLLLSIGLDALGLTACAMVLSAFAPAPATDAAAATRLGRTAALTLAGGVYTTVSLQLFGHLIQLLWLVCAGIVMPQLMLSPEASVSLREFWGKRWNTVIQRSLKDGVYAPLLQKGRAWCSRELATAATFAASGLIHTYPVFVATLSVGAGLHMLSYFLSQLVLMGLEQRLQMRRRGLSSRRAFTFLSLLLPAPLLFEPLLAMRGVALF